MKDTSFAYRVLYSPNNIWRDVKVFYVSRYANLSSLPFRPPARV